MGHLYLLLDGDSADLYEDVHGMLNEWGGSEADVWAVLPEENDVVGATVTDHDNGEYEVVAGPLYEYVLYEGDDVVEHRFQVGGEETVLVEPLDEDDEDDEDYEEAG